MTQLPSTPFHAPGRGAASPSGLWACHGAQWVCPGASWALCFWLVSFGCFLQDPLCLPFLLHLLEGQLSQGTLVPGQLLLVLFIFWPRPVACGSLPSWKGFEPAPFALEVRSLNHWTTREVPPSCSLCWFSSLPHALPCLCPVPPPWSCQALWCL